MAGDDERRTEQRGIERETKTECGKVEGMAGGYFAQQIRKESEEEDEIN